jgi:hypothetical protein
MTDKEALELLSRRINSGDGDRVALLDEIASQVAATGQPRLAHLLRKVRNLTGSPHFDEALADFTAALNEASESPVDDPAVPEATRDELYEMAKQAAIPGRSSMTKKELADALEQTT